MNFLKFSVKVISPLSSRNTWIGKWNNFNPSGMQGDVSFRGCNTDNKREEGNITTVPQSFINKFMIFKLWGFHESVNQINKKYSNFPSINLIYRRGNFVVIIGDMIQFIIHCLIQSIPDRVHITFYIFCLLSQRCYITESLRFRIGFR